MKKNKVIFLSHASGDRDIVKAFVDHVFTDNVVAKTPFRVVYSSSDNIDHRVGVGSNIWKTIDDDIHATVYFCAFLSESYFQSQWCIAELALFSELIKFRGNLPAPALLKIDDRSDGLIKSNPLTQALNVFSMVSESDLWKFIEELKVEGVPYDAGIDENSFFVCLNKAKNVISYRKKGVFFDLARRCFTKLNVSVNPISFLVQREEYEATAINMGRAAKKKLLWTVYQSPLLVEDAYLDGDFLTNYDKSFSEFSLPKKVRLVIFRDRQEAQAYDLLMEEWHDKQFGANKKSKKLLALRKKNFEESAKKNRGELLFTTADKFVRCVNFKRRCDNTSFLEFAYGDYGEEGSKPLLMETGFSSPFARKNPRAAGKHGHITFYMDLGQGVMDTINKVNSYKKFYGHLHDLWELGGAVFMENRNKDVFFESGNISMLYKEGAQ